MITLRKIHTITPSHMINTMIYRYYWGKITWGEVISKINTLVTEGELHPDTDVRLIKRIADFLYR